MDYSLENRIKKLEEQIMACEVCKEKQVEINRILKAYKAEKKFLAIALSVAVGALVIVSGLGNEGLRAIIEIIKSKTP